MSSTVPNIPETFSPPPRNTVSAGGGNDQPKSSSLYLCVPRPPLQTTPKGVVGTNILQVHVLVDPFLTFGSVDGHRPSIVLAQEAISHGPAGAAGRSLPSTWRFAWGLEEEELRSKTKALGYLDKTRRRGRRVGEWTGGNQSTLHGRPSVLLKIQSLPLSRSLLRSFHKRKRSPIIPLVHHRAHRLSKNAGTSARPCSWLVCSPTHVHSRDTALKTIVPELAQLTRPQTSLAQSKFRSSSLCPLRITENHPY